MGSTFTNLQIYCGYEFDKNQVLDQVNKYLYDCGYLTKEVLDAQEQLVKYASEANVLGEIIYFPIEFQLVNDGVRSMNVDFQKAIDENIKFYLDKFNIAHKTIKGTIEQRFNFICELLK